MSTPEIVPEAKRSHPLRVVLIVVLVIACIVGGYAFALVTSARTMEAAADRIEAAASGIEQAVNSSDIASVRSNIQALCDDAALLNEQAGGAIWTAAAYIPVYGQDAVAVRTLATAVDDLAQNALAPVADALPPDDFATLGLIDKAKAGVAAMQDLASVMPSAAAVVTRVTEQVDGIGTLHIEKLNNAVARLRAPLDKISTTLATADGAVTKLSGLFGLL